MSIIHEGNLGKSDKEARVGDVVDIFDGSDVPFVIRKTRSDDGLRWKLVGECYLCGWMDGSYSDHRIVDDLDDGLATADTYPNADSSYNETLLSEYFVPCWSRRQIFSTTGALKCKPSTIFKIAYLSVLSAMFSSMCRVRIDLSSESSCM